MLVENIGLQGPDHATAEMEIWMGHYARLILFKLEKQTGTWQVTDAYLAIEG